MGLFDDKEEVLDFQFTQYGKRMLGLGKFKPEFYAFCDDEILYDSRYGNHSESQNTAQTRILDETARTKVQHLYHGIETEFKNDVSKLDPDEFFLGEAQPETERVYSSINALGNSKYNNSFAPAWKLNLRASEISSSASTITGSISDIRIPQIHLKQVAYQINRIKGVPSDIQEQLDFQDFEDNILDGEIMQFDDGSILEVVNSDIFIDLEEANSVFQNGNFEIELFMVEEKETNITENGETVMTETLTPLYFNQKPFKRDDIYDEEEFFQVVETNVDPTMVEYYVDVQADDEIPLSILCRYIPEDQRRGVYGKFRNCQDRTIVLKPKMYETDVDELDLDEDC